MMSKKDVQKGVRSIYSKKGVRKKGVRSIYSVLLSTYIELSAENK
ncbi:MAG: hypothetical protein ACYCSQ_09225 [bacterium]